MNALKLEWKDAGPDGWSRKPYQIARLGKLTFRLRARTRGASRATIAVSHDDIRHEGYACKTTSPIVFESRPSTAAARDYAENFDYQAWRYRETEKAKQAVETAQNDLARCEKRLRAAEGLALNA